MFSFVHSSTIATASEAKEPMMINTDSVIDWYLKLAQRPNLNIRAVSGMLPPKCRVLITGVTLPFRVIRGMLKVRTGKASRQRGVFALHFQVITNVRGYFRFGFPVERPLDNCID